MKEKGSNYLRELIRILIRDLRTLEKSDVNCCGITISQCNAIMEIGKKEEISLNEISELLMLDKSTMSRTINKLVENGMVIRELQPQDKRYVTIELTDKGIAIFKNIEETIEQYYKGIFMKISKNKREQIFDSLGLLIDVANGIKYC